MAYIFHVCVNSLTENVIFENANIFNVFKMLSLWILHTHAINLRQK